MTTRRWVISVAAATLVVGGFIGVDRLNRRAVRFGNMADYHRRMEQESDAKAAFFEGLANDPSKETDLPPALFDEGIWSRGQALEMELESNGLHPSRRWKTLVSKAKEIAIDQSLAYKRASEYHSREWSRYSRAAFSPWLWLRPDATP
jgi:hypothetical protein